MVSLRSSRTNQLKKLGIVNLTVQIKGYSCLQPFVVARKVTSDLILRTIVVLRVTVEVLILRKLSCVGPKRDVVEVHGRFGRNYEPKFQRG